MSVPESWQSIFDRLPEPTRVGGRELFERPSEEPENWPEGWVPLERVDDHATLVVFEDAVWVGRREGRGPELDDTPVFEAVDALLDAVTKILELAEWEHDGDLRWLTPSAEDALWQSLPDAARLFDVFRLETRTQTRSLRPQSTRRALICAFICLAASA